MTKQLRDYQIELSVKANAILEEWKCVPDFENYQVSTFGRVKRIECNVMNKIGISSFYPEKELKQELVKGYKRVTFSNGNIQKRYTVHRLVAICFIPNPENKRDVNHIDGNKINNCLNNLEWNTQSENERHSYRVIGKINPQRKLTEANVKDIRENAIKGVNHSKTGNIIDFVKKYNVDRTTILNVLNKTYYVKKS